MKKIIYYIFLSIFLLVLVILLIMPFGGVMVVYHFLSNGLFADRYFMENFGGEVTPLLRTVNQIMGLFFLICITLPVILLFMKNVSFNRKFTITAWCLVIFVLMFAVPNMYKLF